MEPATTQKSCRLRHAAEGVTEPCPGADCPFWELGGAVLAGDCLIERLGVDLSERGLAAYLLETRVCLEEARSRAEVEQAHSEFSRRIGLEL